MSFSYQFIFVPLSELQEDRVVGLGDQRRRLEVRRWLDGVANEVGMTGGRVVHRRPRGGDGVAWGSGHVSSCN